ncbi:MAG: type VI secretion system-associated protein TagF [Rubrivivax sp.]|nr:MAG: type VI secretion system-associated protein TagF [Rubrivivax sp.]
MAADTAPGWYGKLGGLGDFASRRLPQEWLQGCDLWLSACLDETRNAMGGNWPHAYLASPVWRFVWGPEVIDSSWWFGVLVPSSDSVGRHFPLLVAQPRPQPPTDRFGLDHLEWWWAQASLAARAAREPGTGVEQFEAVLADLPPWPSQAPAWVKPLPASWGQQWRMPAATSLSELSQQLAAETLQRRLVGHSFWWPHTTTQSFTQSLLIPGLPQPAQFAAMTTAPLA